MGSAIDTAVVQGFCTYSNTRPEVEPWEAYHKWQPPMVSTPARIVARYPVQRVVVPIDPTQDTRGQLYKEDAFIQGTRPYADSYECARFYAPMGRIGIVRQAWQWLQLANPEPLRNNGTPFDALYAMRSLDGDVVITWRLRLTYGEVKGARKLLPPGRYVSGYGYPEFSNWSELRFPWGSDAPVYWFVPENMTLMLFAEVLDGKQRIDNLGGRLSGYTQPIGDISARNTRIGWQW